MPSFIVRLVDGSEWSIVADTDEPKTGRTYEAQGTAGMFGNSARGLEARTFFPSVTIEGDHIIAWSRVHA